MAKPNKQTAEKPVVEENKETFVTLTDGQRNTRLTLRYGGVNAIGGTADGTAVVYLSGGDRLLVNESEADVRAALGWPEKEAEEAAE